MTQRLEASNYDPKAWNGARTAMAQAADHIIRQLELAMLDAPRGARRYYYEPRLEALLEWRANLGP